MKKTLLSLGLFALSISPLMAGQSTTITTIDAESDNSYDPAIVRYDGHTAVAYQEDGELKLWIDNGAGDDGVANDGIANGDEIVVIDDEGFEGNLSVDMIVHDDKLTIAYYDSYLGSFKIWHDDGYAIDNVGQAISEAKAGNGVVDDDEIRAAYGEESYFNGFKMLDYNGNLAVAFLRESEGDTLYLWIDDGEEGDAGNFIVDGPELREIDSEANFSRDISLALVNEQLMLSYFNYSNDMFYYWSDDGEEGDAGNAVVDEGEIRSFDGESRQGEQSSIIDYNGNAAVFLSDDDDYNLSVWIDDGAGDGTAGDNDIHEDEIRVIGYVGDDDPDAQAVILDGKLACVFYDQSDVDNDGYDDNDLAIWIDHNGNGKFDDGERTKIDEGTVIEGTEEVDENDGDVGEDLDVFVEDGNLYVSYEDDDADNIRLARITKEVDKATPLRKRSHTCVVANAQTGLLAGLMAFMLLALGFSKKKAVVVSK